MLRRSTYGIVENGENYNVDIWVHGYKEIWYRVNSDGYYDWVKVKVANFNSLENLAENPVRIYIMINNVKKFVKVEKQ